MSYRPFNSELGQRIYDNVSLEAWRLWLEYAKMLINESRLDVISAEGRRLLLQQIEHFFFGDATASGPGPR